MFRVIQGVIFLADKNGNVVDTVPCGGTRALPVSMGDGWRATYSASVVGLVLAASATDFFTITGAAGKVIRVTRLFCTGTQTTGGTVNFLVIKRSTANSGGTSVVQTAVPHDSNSAAASATVRAYTANPTTLGTSLGTLRSMRDLLPGVSAGTTTSVPQMDLHLGNRPAQAFVLRSASEVIAFNFNGATAAGSLLDVDIEWTEE